MSLIVLRRCPIKGCRFNEHPVLADKASTKNHILRDHDYQEKQEAAFQLGIITSNYERRSPQWLAENLSEFSNGEN